MGLHAIRFDSRRAHAQAVLVALTLCACTGDDEGQGGAGAGGVGGAQFAAGGSGGAAGTAGMGSFEGTGGVGAGGTAGTMAGAGGTGGTAGAAGSGGVTSGSGGDAGDASTAGGPAPGPWTSQPIADPPTYMGSKNGSSGCSTPAPTLGFEPVDDQGGQHPLFLYFVGTTFSASDTSARYDSEAAKTVTEAMARRGFVALSTSYDNTINLSADKVTCAYGSSNAQSLLAIACALPNVDCEMGIATWGHSQGALMAHVASQYEPRVKAAWVTGYGGGSYPLPNNRLRVVNGEADTMNGTWAMAKKAAGYGTNECPDNGGDACLRPDGSGFILVRASECEKSTADHCWFDRISCGDGAITLEPNWIDPSSTKAFALELNADWVAETVARP